MSQDIAESMREAVTSEHRVIRSVMQWLSLEEPVWLCTIVKTWGASPRPAGSILAFHPEKGVVGSLSGGCIEEALLRKLALDSNGDLSTKTPFLYEYEISGEDQVQYSLPCGGQLTILVEHVRSSMENQQHFRSLLSSFDQRQCVLRQISIRDGSMSLKHSKEDTHGAELGCAVQIEDNVVSTRFGPICRMLLLGAGEVSRCVAQLANTLDFAVTICDPRESYLQGFELDGVHILQCLPDDLIREQFTDTYCAILALAHDPRVDDMALMQALKMDAFYIGAMGSLRTTRARTERLASLGCTEDEIARLHAPIGLDIGSKKPAEIAVSIMAQVLAIRSEILAN